MKKETRNRKKEKRVMGKFINAYFVHHTTNSGYIALITVILLSAVTLGIAATVSLLAIGEADSSLALSNGENTLTFVEGCMEDALLKARNSNSYTGGTITRPEGTCSITVSTAGNVWTVTATTTAASYKRTVQAIVTRTSNLTITSWQEQ